MHSNGHRVHIALEIEAGLLDKAVILWIANDERQGVPLIRLARPAEIQVEERVSAGQEPGRFGRSVLSQLDGNNHRRGDENDRQNQGERASNSHEMWSGQK